MRRAAADPLAPLAGADGTGPEAPPARVDAPEIQRVGDEVALTWPPHGVTVSFGALRESGDGIHGEVSVVSGVLGELHWSRLNLASGPAREGLVKKLSEAAPGLPWRPLLEAACRQTARIVREGEPVVTLTPRLADSATRYLVPKLLLSGETNMIFADGGQGKSLLALAVAVAVASGVALPAGLQPMSTGPALYLDWESTREEHEDRLARLVDGLGATLIHPILYRPMSRALADDAALLRAEIDRNRVGLVSVDSLAPACGAEPEGADSLIRCFNALRSFGPVTRLVLAHVSKLAAEAKGAAKPYGSVFAFNLSRNAWEIRRADTDGGAELVMALFHRKNNAGPLLPPLGLRFQAHESAGMTTVHAHDIGQEPDLAARASLAFRLQAALARGSRTVQELAEETGGGKQTVTRTLRRFRADGKVIELGAGRWGFKA
jgi:hypothetical protein